MKQTSRCSALDLPRVLVTAAFFAALGASAIVLSGCDGSPRAITITTTTTKGNYTITITGTSGTISRSTTVMLTVE